MRLAAALLLIATTAHAAPKAAAQETAKAEAPAESGIAKYFSELEKMKLVDVETGTLAALRKELQVAETLLQAAQNGKRVKGFRRVIYSGVTTNHLADMVAGWGTNRLRIPPDRDLAD